MQEMYLKPIKINYKFYRSEIETPRINYGLDKEKVKFVCIDYENSISEKLRITFEMFDSLNISRGEYLPYYSENPNLRIINEVVNSDWLKKRDIYESKYYKCSLLEDYSHYIFSFHDEFIEVIAQGFWIEKINDKDELKSENHPFNDLKINDKTKEIIINSRTCLLVENTLSIDTLIENSKFCSQKLFQYYIKYKDGTFEPDYYASVRTKNDKIITKFISNGWGPTLSIKEGAGTILDFEDFFTDRVNKIGDY